MQKRAVSSENSPQDGIFCTFVRKSKVTVRRKVSRFGTSIAHCQHTSISYFSLSQSLHCMRRFVAGSHFRLQKNTRHRSLLPSTFHRSFANDGTEADNGSVFCFDPADLIYQIIRPS
jgi:hypothetical protein